MSQLNGKNAVVTGGNSGIGLAIARRFAAEGADVTITGRRQAALDAAVAEIGGQVTAVQGDVTSEADLDRLAAQIQALHGKLDILVVNSGVAEPAALGEIGPEHFDKTFDINVRAALFTVQKLLPLMADGGAIVLVGSIAGFIGTPNYTVYGASKAAIRSFARTWAKELAPRGIRVNTLSPGPIDTPIFDNATDELRETLGKMIPLGRFGRPEEAAAAALFLASDQSSFVTGAELCVDGGLAQG
ncbi:glucose 1-dehydrogenase [Acidisoma cellulosilytica]|uniref:Glucose 1-dehydrogenase n=1 Tax=Acidisoma cellulosilyticum TaxID=2802395 RepID=A0A964E301_9PROT|nr:glucose 1-dehydrogenase [Acidisoma cellulosilyticum]MCB8879946.1 glucose 1-dehydrogenase [Acidisoma cellulosilyticum]